MKKKVILCALTLLSLPNNLAAQDLGKSRDDGVNLSLGAVVGYYGGIGFHGNATISNISPSDPFQVRFGIGYAAISPGDSAAARRIFINDATNGVPDEQGRMWDSRMDVLVPAKAIPFGKAYVVGGPRYSRFTGNFKYIGGNEDFDVRSTPWGLGIGLESHFTVSKRFDLIVSGCYDYFFSSSLKGHDTWYTPNGRNSSPRDDYTYSDADDAINQPKHEIRLMLGMAYDY